MSELSELASEDLTGHVLPKRKQKSSMIRLAKFSRFARRFGNTQASGWVPVDANKAGTARDCDQPDYNASKVWPHRRPTNNSPTGLCKCEQRNSFALEYQQSALRTIEIFHELRPWRTPWRTWIDKRSVNWLVAAANYGPAGNAGVGGYEVAGKEQRGSTKAWQTQRVKFRNKDLRLCARWYLHDTQSDSRSAPDGRRPSASSLRCATPSISRLFSARGQGFVSSFRLGNSKSIVSDPEFGPRIARIVTANLNSNLQSINFK